MDISNIVHSTEDQFNTDFLNTLQKYFSDKISESPNLFAFPV